MERFADAFELLGVSLRTDGPRSAPRANKIVLEP
jgi:hypothetical protein